MAVTENHKINWDLLKTIAIDPTMDPALFKQQFMTTATEETFRKYNSMIERHEEAAVRGQDNPIIEIAHKFSRQFYRDPVTRDYGANTIRFVCDDEDDDNHGLQVIGSLEGRWRNLADENQIMEVLMRNSGLDVTWRSMEYRTSEMSLVVSELLHKLFYACPVRFTTSTRSTLEKHLFTDRSYKTELNHVTISAAGYMVVAYGNDKTRSVIGDARLFHYLRDAGFCMFFLKKESTEDKEMLMIATHRKMGRIFKYPIRDKEFSAMMVGNEWTESERMMAEMVGFKDQIWLDSKEMKHIMNIPTLKPEEIEKWREAYLF